MKHLFNKFANQIESAEIFALDATSVGVGFSNNLLKSTSMSQNAGISLRIFKDGRLAQASTSNPEAYERIFAKTIELTRYMEPAQFTLPTPQPLSPLALYDPACENFSIQEMVDIGQSLIDKMREYDKEILTFCGFGYDVENVNVLNTNGLDYSFKRSNFSFGVGGKLVEGTNILMMHEAKSSLHPITDHAKYLSKVIADIDIARNNVPFQGKSVPVIFTPLAMADILISFQEGLNGANVAKKTSPLCGKLGEVLFDERLTVIDDPLNPDGVASNPFDDEGTACKHTYIVKNGKLCNYLLDRKNAAKLDMESTGNGYRRKSLLLTHGYSYSISPHTSNLVMEPGDIMLDEMISYMGDGLIVDEITGILLGNLLNGDFSGVIGLGYKVQNGKRIGRVKDVMIAGNFYKLFSQKLMKLSSERMWTGALGGSSGSYLLPWTLFKDVDVATKE